MILFRDVINILGLGRAACFHRLECQYSDVQWHNATLILEDADIKETHPIYFLLRSLRSKANTQPSPTTPFIPSLLFTPSSLRSTTCTQAKALQSFRHTKNTPTVCHPQTANRQASTYRTRPPSRYLDLGVCKAAFGSRLELACRVVSRGC